MSDADAKYDLVYAYLSGKGVEKDETKAQTLMDEALKTDGKDREYFAVTLYQKGYEAYKARKDDEAFPFLKKSAELGHYRANIYLGECYRHGYGIPMDKEKAFPCLKKGADGGDKDAKKWLKDLKKEMIRSASVNSPRSVSGEELYINFKNYAIFFIIGYGIRILTMAYVVELLPLSDSIKFGSGGPDDLLQLLSLNDLSEFFSVSYLLQLLSRSDLMQLFSFSSFLHLFSLNILLHILSVVVVFLPMWWNFVKGDYMSIFQIPNYAVITTTSYADGSISRSSDYGGKSNNQNKFVKFLRLSQSFFVAIPATIVALVFQFVVFFTKFPKVKNKLQYLAALAVIVGYIVIGPAISMKLAPVFDPRHFNPAEIAGMIETSQKNLYAGDFSYIVKNVDKKTNRIKFSFDAAIAYTKSTDTTVIEIIPAAGMINGTPSQQQTERSRQESEKLYMQEFDRGKNIIPIGRYTFKGNGLINSEISGGRKISDAGIAELINLLPVNLIFKRLSDDKKKLRVIEDNPEHSPDKWSIRHPNGTNRKKKIKVTFLKTGGDYRITRFWTPSYEIYIND